jgi:hypothetical protein
MCEKTDCPFYSTLEGCTHPGAPAPEECDLYDMFPVTDNTAPEPPMYVKFTYEEEWRHIPAYEVFPVWIESDINRAALVFQKKHSSKGKLVVFVTENGGIDWKVLHTVKS